MPVPEDGRLDVGHRHRTQHRPVDPGARPGRSRTRAPLQVRPVDEGTQDRRAVRQAACRYELDGGARDTAKALRIRVHPRSVEICVPEPEAGTIGDAMTAELVALGIDANDPATLARFWSGVLGWRIVGTRPAAPPSSHGDDTGFSIRFLHSPDKKSGRELAAPPSDQQLARASTADDLTGRSPSVLATWMSGSFRRSSMWSWPTRRATSSASSSRATSGWPTAAFSAELACDGSRDVGLLLERRTGLAACLGPGSGDRHPVTARRSEDQPGRPAPEGKDRAGPAAVPPRRATRRRPGVGGRPAGLTRRHSASASGTTTSGGSRWPTPMGMSSAS